MERIFKVKETIAQYPSQFWVLFCGRFIGSAGGSLVWPFMTIYLRQRLNISLTTVGLLLAISSGVGLFSQAIWGPVVDRFGRKLAMLAGLLNEIMVMVGLALLGSLEAYAVLIALSGLIEPASRIGADAMIADLVEADKRAGAYALLRMISMAGWAIGPAVGGVLAATSYLLSFGTAAATASVVLLSTIFLVKETKQELPEAEKVHRPAGGYGYILRDLHFLAFCGASILLFMAYEPFLDILPVYMKEGFGIAESGFGVAMATNGLMLVLFQFTVTRVTERYPETYVMAAGAFFTGLAALAATLSNSFWLFLLAMIIMTIGELIWGPTSIAFVAKVAPSDMRGRYMGVYGAACGIAWGIGPITSGYFYDNIAPVSVWHLALVFAIACTLAFGFIGKMAPLAHQSSLARNTQNETRESERLTKA
ncbi:MAG: MDR family MFS transporter [Anaerolineae bacterium]